MAELPLAGVRILAFTQLGAGPYAMMVLGDLGAEVAKVEDPISGGDEARRVPPGTIAGDSLYFQALNRNARSLTLNLRVPEGQALLRRLARVCDVVYCNLRGDLPAKLGLDYAALGRENPRLVCCALSGFGKSGPRASEPGYDFLIQALAGFMSLTGEPDGEPQRCGVSVADFAGGLMSAVGVLAGLLRARATGVGGDVDVSLLDTAVSMLNYMVTWWFALGHKPQRFARGAHQSLVPSQTFATRDGFLVVMCMKEKFWQELCDCLGKPAWTEDPRFATMADRFRHRHELLPLLEKEFLRRSTGEWLTLLRGRVPCAPVNDLEAALAEEQLHARDMLIEVPHPHWGTLREVGCPIKFAGVDPSYQAASACGADTEHILRTWLGLDEAAIAALRQKRAI
ncbi:MAG: CoA transferase [Candidatus Binatia bacterium]|nr:CoA transferase [Candidatus Binatia bacterium]